MDRRKFVKQSCTACLAVSAGMMITSLSSCATLPTYKAAIADHKVAVPLDLFANSNFQLIQPKGMYYNIGLRKEADGTYTALLLRCTHADNQLVASANGTGYTCNLHGSKFNQEGQVTNGPADRALKKYPTQVESNQIIINIA
jgi:nitrite reductase/ring-hydroxylating ferredoxin subunit